MPDYFEMEFIRLWWQMPRLIKLEYVAPDSVGDVYAEYPDEPIVIENSAN